MILAPYFAYVMFNQSVLALCKHIATDKKSLWTFVSLHLQYHSPSGHSVGSRSLQKINHINFWFALCCCCWGNAYKLLPSYLPLLDSLHFSYSLLIYSVYLSCELVRLSFFSLLDSKTMSIKTVLSC